MSGVLAKILTAPARFPLVRGMLSYAIIWPSCSLVQEYLEHGTGLAKANWARAARFSFFGTFFMAPVFYGWMKYSNRFFKRKDLMTAISRAAVEQVSYSPLAMAYFFFGMSVLEGKSYNSCINEVREKFWPTYKIGVVFWPTAQTLNFYLVSEKNRIVFVSVASFVWTVYLAHMKGKQQKNEQYMGSEPQQLNIEPMSATLDPDKSNVDSILDQTPLVAAEISPDLMSQQKPVVEVKGDVGSIEKPVLVVDTKPEENIPKLVSDIRPEGEETPHLVVETLADPEDDEEEGESIEEVSDDDMMELLSIMP